MTKSQLTRCEKIYNKNKSSYHKLTMMAFLFKGNSLLNYGINSNKTDPVQNKYRVKSGIHMDIEEYLDKVHAEVNCLKPYIENKEINFNNLTLLVISKKADGTFRNSKPCPVCRKLLESLNIGTICYFYNGRFITEKKI